MKRLESRGGIVSCYNRITPSFLPVPVVGSTYRGSFKDADMVTQPSGDSGEISPRSQQHRTSGIHVHPAIMDDMISL